MNTKVIRFEKKAVEESGRCKQNDGRGNNVVEDNKVNGEGKSIYTCSKGKVEKVQRKGGRGKGGRGKGGRKKLEENVDRSKKAAEGSTR